MFRSLCKSSSSPHGILSFIHELVKTFITSPRTWYNSRLTKKIKSSPCNSLWPYSTHQWSLCLRPASKENKVLQHKIQLLHGLIACGLTDWSRRKMEGVYIMAVWKDSVRANAIANSNECLMSSHRRGRKRTSVEIQEVVDTCRYYLCRGFINRKIWQRHIKIKTLERKTWKSYKADFYLLTYLL